MNGLDARPTRKSGEGSNGRQVCDIGIDQVRQLALDDFTMLASEVLWRIEQASVAMGLPADFFLNRKPQIEA